MRVLYRLRHRAAHLARDSLPRVAEASGLLAPATMAQLSSKVIHKHGTITVYGISARRANGSNLFLLVTERKSTQD